MKHRYQVPLKLKAWGWLILLLFVVTLSVQSPLQASASKTRCQVDYIKNKLTVSADNVTLGQLLAAIREKTGIEFVIIGQEQSEIPISIEFGPLPVAEGLRRILSHSNHAFIFGTNNKLIKVVILNYTKLDGDPKPHEGTETSSAQSVISPFPAEIQHTKPTAKDGRMVASSLQPMGTKLSSIKDVVVKPSSVTMSIRPTVVSVEDMMIPTPPDVIASKVKNMMEASRKNPNQRVLD